MPAPLDVPVLLALLVASELEAETRARGERMEMSERLQMALWRQRHALITNAAATAFLPPPAAEDLAQLEMF